MANRIPLTLPPNIDPAHATLAYGNWAPDRLKRELEDEDLKTRRLAVFALSQYLHDPEHVASVVNVGVANSLKKLMRDKDNTCRKVAADSVATLNTHTIGREACTKEGLLVELEVMLNDKDKECRMSSHKAINMLSGTVEGCLGIIETKSLLPNIGRFITKDSRAVKAVALDSISKILMADVERARDQIVEGNLLVILHNILEVNMGSLTLSALDCLASITFSRMARDTEEVYQEFTPQLMKLLKARDWRVRSKSALCLANVCRYSKTKLKVTNANGLDLLFPLTRDESKEVRANALAALNRLVEHESARGEALKRIDYLKPLLNDPVPIVRKQAEIAIKLITWKA